MDEYLPYSITNRKKLNLFIWYNSYEQPLFHVYQGMMLNVTFNPTIYSLFP